VTFIRAVLFFLWFWLVSIPLAIGYSVLLLAHRRAMMIAVRIWAKSLVWGLWVFGGVKMQVRGLQYLPREQALVASKHQSLFDFIGPFVFLPDACFVMKQELFSIPFFGWHARKQEMIPIHREGHARALKDLVRTTRERLKEPRQVVIFPEGTRQKPGAPPDYKPGVAALYRDLQLPCTPMATNSGVHLNSKGILLKTGTIVFDILPPIPAGLKRAEFMEALETSIESASNALLEAGI
jgi:1-acyl-sn-glycerol-3-phosphate acyltransferase